MRGGYSCGIEVPLSLEGRPFLMLTLDLDDLIRHALKEDIHTGDLTTQACVPELRPATARLVAKEAFVLAGLQVAGRVFSLLDPMVRFEALAVDGARLQSGTVMARISGDAASLLQAERVALNLLQRLSGIATLTAAFVDEVRGYPARITDTRKTTPGLRVFEKYAVQAGGGSNHRFNLTDGVLIKDNHIAACGSITEAVARVRTRVPHTIRIEVETENLEQVKECLDCRVDIIMLDNMNVAAMREAVALIGGRALVEASGGVTLANIKAIAATGVDIISIGALTHSAPSCDIGMDWLL